MRQEGRADAFDALAGLHLLLTDAELALVNARHAPLCVEGCGWCCSHNVPVAAGVEAAYLVARYRSDLTGRFEAVLDRIETWLQEPMPEGTLYPEATPLVLRGTPVRSVDARAQERLEAQSAAVASGRCPLLGDDLRCSVHEYRPMACRAYGVTTAPHPTECQRPLDAGEMASNGAFRHINRNMGDQLERLMGELLGELDRVDPELAQAGLLPTVIFATARPLVFGRLVREGRVPQCKLGVLPAAPPHPYPGGISQRRMERMMAAHAAPNATAKE